MNTNNFTFLTGRLVDNAKVFKNTNGSATVTFRLAVKNNYLNADRTVGSQFIPVKRILSAKEISAGKLENGVLSRIHKGDKITVQGTLRNNNYTDKNGVQHYEIELHAETITFEESKAVVDQRLANRNSTDTTEMLEQSDEDIAETLVDQMF